MIQIVICIKFILKKHNLFEYKNLDFGVDGIEIGNLA